MIAYTDDDVDRFVSDYAKSRGITTRQLRGPHTHQGIARFRQELYYLLRARMVGYVRIGRALGGRDHSTVISGIKRYTKLLETQRAARMVHEGAGL